MTNITLNNIHYSYNNMTKILEGVSLEMEVGKMYAILGPSGTGKTTLLSLIGGLDSPNQGDVLFNGQKIGLKESTTHRRENVAFIFQSYNLIDYMNAKENVELTSQKDAKETLFSLGLSQNEIKRNVLKLSGGQQQRVAIARALAADTPFILADEPTGNLDEETAAEITQILKECATIRNKCVVIVTHSQEVANKADIIFELSKGEIRTKENR